MSPIKAGDLLYAVGPGHHAPHSSMDLCVYSTVVKNIRLEGSYSASATPADLASAHFAIELNDDRPVLGFPKWTYGDYEIGISVHRSAAEALRAFTKYAQMKHGEAERALESAAQKLKWASEQTLALTTLHPEVTP